MNVKENRKKWVEALRSGEYKQGRGQLHYRSYTGNEEFCCLGVACDLARRDIELEITERSNYVIYDGDAAGLPASVMDWLGITDDTGAYGDDNQLSSDNDGGKSFEEIADIIESEPPGLFRG